MRGMARHLWLSGHAKQFHVENQQPISNGKTPPPVGIMSSHTYTLEQTGTTQACE